MRPRRLDSAGSPGLSMSEALRQFSAPSPGALSGILSGILVLWLIWPVAGALLGARRGRAWSGFVNGLMWGPFGLLPVLLSSRRHRCPTCGKMTLNEPAPVVLPAARPRVTDLPVAAPIARRGIWVDPAVVVSTAPGAPPVV